MFWKRWTAVVLLGAGVTARVAAQSNSSQIDTGDTAWMLVSCALVMLMTPGLALFYGGMVRQKNVLSTMMHSITILAVATVHWVVIGYALAFGPSIGGFIGKPVWAFLHGVGQQPNVDYAPTIPHSVFMAFQMMFAIITPALISGAIAERMKFSTFVAFVVLWLTLVYAPIAHWVWGVGGWLRHLGALDFAGGTVVHISSGISGLVAAWMLRPRLGYLREAMLPNNLTLTILGAGMLWFGWFGFNAGSALAAGGLAASAFAATHIASAAATLSWIVVEWAHRGKPSALGAVSGCIAGLVAITPAAGFVSLQSALIIGARRRSGVLQRGHPQTTPALRRLTGRLRDSWSWGDDRRTADRRVCQQGGEPCGGGRASVRWLPPVRCAAAGNRHHVAVRRRGYRRDPESVGCVHGFARQGRGRDYRSGHHAARRKRIQLHVGGECLDGSATTLPEG
jgi:ammonium transporter